MPSVIVIHLQVSVLTLHIFGFTFTALTVRSDENDRRILRDL